MSDSVATNVYCDHFLSIIDDKPGVCPDIDVSSASECPPPKAVEKSCMNDNECTGYRKCCSNGCHLECMDAKSAEYFMVKGLRGPKGKPGDKVSNLFNLQFFPYPFTPLPQKKNNNEKTIILRRNKSQKGFILS